MARVTATEPYDVIVVGGGASGLAAALAAARAGAHTAIVERDVACGLPILATGNGRCNLSNAELDPVRYRHPAAARTVMGEHPERELAAWFASVGIVCAREGNLLYPYSKRAESVRDALVDACERAGVEFLCCHDIIRAVRRDATSDGAGAWKLDVLAPTRPLRARGARDAKSELRALRKALASAPKHSLVLHARAIVLAPGGACASACQLFGVPHLDEEPVLCPIACVPDAALARAETTVLARLDGLRVEAAVSLARGDETLWRERGEVLFRSYGLSGVVIFNLSRRVERGDTIELDLFPEFTEPSLTQHLREREDAVGSLSPRAHRWFDGMLAPALGRVVVALGAGTPEGCAHAAKHLRFLATGRTEARAAQVRRGGIPCSAWTVPTLALDRDAALFACGEALDMDADCGGYNLSWAWLSGLRAGTSAAQAAARASRASKR